jgi:putative ABC transport system substrate-binding protein
MAIHIRRREFIVALGGAATWPIIGRAQPTIPVVGFVRNTPLAAATPLVTAFRQGLKEAGFVEGENAAVEYFSAEGRDDRLPGLVADVVRRMPAVIAANGVTALAAKAVTTTIPIVFATGGDPVEQGLVTSLNQPGGNVTGVNFFDGALGAKRLELLRQLVPKAALIGMLVNPNTTETEAERRDVQAAAQAMGQKLLVIDVRNERDIDLAFANFVGRRAGAVLVGAGAFIFANRTGIVAQEAHHALPTCHITREAVEAGALMSYGTNIPDAYRQAGIYVGRILKGEKPADLPVMRSTKFDLVINLKTAKALGIEIPAQMLALADEVIE